MTEKKLNVHKDIDYECFKEPRHKYQNKSYHCSYQGTQIYLFLWNEIQTGKLMGLSVEE